jgi:hypothetical protein
MPQLAPGVAPPGLVPCVALSPAACALRYNLSPLWGYNRARRGSTQAHVPQMFRRFAARDPHTLPTARLPQANLNDYPKGPAQAKACATSKKRSQLSP